MRDFLVWDHAGMQDHYREEEIRERIRQMTSMLAQFLELNELCIKRLSDVYGDIAGDLVIRSSDLTGEGISVIVAGLDNWLRANDDNKKVLSDRSLQRALKKVRR